MPSIGCWKYFNYWLLAGRGPLPADVNAISASDVRRRIREGAPWQHLVPDVIVPLVREIYRPPAE